MNQIVFFSRTEHQKNQSGSKLLQINGPWSSFLLKGVWISLLLELTSLITPSKFHDS